MNPSFVTRHPSLPFVFVNMAMTADGKIATANRAVSSFGSAHDHKHLLELRATADAVLAGARTVDSATINLGPGPARFRRQRLKNGLMENNLRIIVSGNGTLNPNAEVFKHRFSPIIILTTGRVSKAKLRQLRALADEVKVCGRQEINFREAFCWLRGKWGVQRLLCEGGGGLNDALFRADLVDELHLTICPKIFGGRDAPAIADGKGFRRLVEALPLQIKSFKRIGNEAFAVFGRVQQR
ncbi:MAG: dihydrofolate reductase family protein [Verrucomicrobiota bacterium]|jgi:riboflavin-specific deaminase-like protein